MLSSDDIIGVHQLLGRYSHLASEHAYDRFDEVFTADAVFDTREMRSGPWAANRDQPTEHDWIFVGLEAIRTAYSGNAERAGTPMTVNTHVYEADGQVKVQSKFLAPFADHWRGGVYDDVVVRGPDGNWRFAHRRAHSSWRCPA